MESCFTGLTRDIIVDQLKRVAEQIKNDTSFSGVKYGQSFFLITTGEGALKKLGYAVPLWELIGLLSPEDMVACIGKQIKKFLNTTSPMSCWKVHEYKNAKWITIVPAIAPNLAATDKTIVKRDHHGWKKFSGQFLLKMYSCSSGDTLQVARTRGSMRTKAALRGPYAGGVIRRPAPAASVCL